MKKILPLFKNVLVKNLKYTAPDVATKIGDIYIPETEKFADANLGEILEVGSEVTEELKKGMVVICPMFGGTSFAYEGENYAIYDEESLLGFVKEGDV